MLAYISRRLALVVPSLLLVSFGVFSLLRLVPGDALMAKIADAGMVPKANLDAIRHQLGIDQPFLVQYVHWLSGLVHGNFGRSLITNRSVLGQIGDALPVTVELALIALSVSVLLAVPVGVLAALKRNSPFDHVLRVLAVTGTAFPDFFLGTVAILALSIWFHYLPPSGFVPFFSDPLKNLSQIWIPALIIGVRLSAVTTRLTRAMMLDVLHQDYVRTASAKGLRQRRVVIRHALKNALIPVVTVVGNQFGALLAGSVVMESLFSLPGVGGLTLASIQQRDYSQIQGNVMVLAAVVLLINLGVDLLYANLDPRVRLSVGQ